MTEQAFIDVWKIHLHSGLTYVYPYELILLYLAFPGLIPLTYTPIPPTPPSRVTLPSAHPAFTMFPTYSPTFDQAFLLFDGLLLTLL